MKIGLVSCVKKKLGVAAPAQDLYVSTLFKKSCRWAEENCDEWYVLSANYGLVLPAQVIRPYELTLKLFGAEDRKQWARGVWKKMHERRLLRPGIKIVWLAGRDYKDELSDLLKSYPQADPMQGLRMGERLKWLSDL
jgi:hypothetical protein